MCVHDINKKPVDSVKYLPMLSVDPQRKPMEESTAVFQQHLCNRFYGESRNHAIVRCYNKDIASILVKP